MRVWQWFPLCLCIHKNFLHAVLFYSHDDEDPHGLAFVVTKNYYCFLSPIATNSLKLRAYTWMSECVRKKKKKMMLMSIGLFKRLIILSRKFNWNLTWPVLSHINVNGLQLYERIHLTVHLCNQQIQNQNLFSNAALLHPNTHLPFPIEQQHVQGHMLSQLSTETYYYCIVKMLCPNTY